MTDSRSEAQSLISAGKVVVKGIPTPKPASMVTPDTPITIATSERQWVSRGAFKLLAALESFPVDPIGKRALDVGASTGGFTEALVAAGAREVVALDVGHGQIHESLRMEPKVRIIERTNFRHVQTGELGEPFEVVVADVSFISLCTLSERLHEQSTATADLIVLVKPQFEAQRREVGSGGVVRDPEVRRAALIKVVRCMKAAGLHTQAVAVSPISGGDGNVEYLLWLRKDRPAVDVEEWM